MTNAVTELIDPTSVQTEVVAATRAAEQWVIDNKVQVRDVASLIRAGEVRKAIGDQQKAIIAKLAKPKSWADGLHKWFCGLERAALAPFTVLDAYEAAEIRAFNEAETRRREAREREIAEARRREDEARAAQVAAAFESDGEPELAAAIVAEAIAAPTPVVVLRDEVKAVQRFRKVRKWRLVDESLVPRAFLQLDTIKLNRYAVAMGDSAAVAGVEFYTVDEPIR